MAKKGEATSKKSPTKKVAVAKPVKRLADDKADKPVVQLRKSSRNAAAAKEDVPEPKSVDKVAKKVKVTSEASKKTKKAAAEETKSKEPVAKESDESMEEEKSDAAENSSLVENGDSSADDVKISKVSIEHCKSWSVFKRKALEVVEVLSSSKYVSNKNELKSELNPNGKQRSGSFEITITLADGQEILVWSGIKRGPPRKLKFPESEVLLTEIDNQVSNKN